MKNSGRGMDIFWNYTFYNNVLIIHVFWFNLVGITCDLMKDHIAGMCCSFIVMLFLQ